MLYLEKKKTGDTVRIKIKNRLFYVLVLDGLSVEESWRLWKELYNYIEPVLQHGDTEYEHHGKFVHYMWWARQKVGIIILTGDVLDRLEETGVDTEEIIKVIDAFEQAEVHIPFCSMNATNFTSSDIAERNVASRVNINTNDETGEVSVSTFSEIFYSAFRM